MGENAWQLGAEEFVVLAVLLVILVFFGLVFKRLLRRK